MQLIFFLILLIQLLTLTLGGLCCIGTFIVAHFLFRGLYPAIAIDRYYAALLGVGIACIPAFGPGTLYAVLSLTLLATDFRKELRWIYPFFSVCLSWWFAACFYEFTLGDYQPFASPGFPLLTRLSAGLDWLRLFPPLYVTLALEASRFLLLAAMISWFSANTPRRSIFLHGLMWSLTLACLLFFLQLTGLVVFPNQNSFWSGTQRWSASFSDPNAFGIFFALSLPLLLTHASSILMRVVLGLSFIFVGSLSGSRSFVLGIAIAALAWLWFRKRSWFYATLVIALCVLVGINLFALQAPEMFVSWVNSLPRGIERAMYTVVADSALQALHSRSLFFAYGLHAWLDNPALGVGLGGFRGVVPIYAQHLGEAFGWTDNANSFYLGILAELGLLGGLLFLWSARNFARRFSVRADAFAPRVMLLTLAVLLVIGPHLQFDEVLLLSAFGLGSLFALREQETRDTRGSFVPLICAMAVVLVGASSKVYGMYAWAMDSQGNYTRWSRAQSRFSLPCENAAARLYLRSTYKRAVTVELRHAAGSESFMLRPLQVEAISLQCPPGARRLPIRLRSNPAWSARLQGSGDSRVFGVQVIFGPKISNRRAL